jgi:hypothetical protein
MISMAQYLLSVLFDDTTDLATGEEMAAIDAFNEQLKADGHWVFAGGLASPSTATVVDGRDREPVFTDGPYLESKEHIAGFWIIEAPAPPPPTATTPTTYAPSRSAPGPADPAALAPPNRRAPPAPAMHTRPAAPAPAGRPHQAPAPRNTSGHAQVHPAWRT